MFSVMKANNIATADRFRMLCTQGFLAEEELHRAQEAAAARGVDLENILINEHNVPRRALLEALSEYYNRPSVEYDERLPVPPELLDGLDGGRLSLSLWFPVIRDGDTVIIAANNPQAPEVLREAREFIGAERYELRVALREDIRWFIQDFLHAKPGQLIGTIRTGLAYWRNTMAHWRTRLACYRTDMAKARTSLAFLRWGLGFIAISNYLMRNHKFSSIFYFYWAMTGAGLLLAVWGVYGYLKIRKSRMTPPGHYTLVEVTSATLSFLEDYHFIEGAGGPPSSGRTMLARLGDFLADYCTILYPSPASKERTHLVYERNVLAGQRTVAACYRTIYARARTGLSCIRSGVSFSTLGLGLMKYFGLSLLTAFDSILVIAGVLMIVDGILWYLPTRKEQSGIPRYPVPP